MTAIHAALLSVAALRGYAQDVQWNRQWGLIGEDRGFDVAADDAGNVYIAGRTTGNVDTQHSIYSDALLIKYSASGEHVWTQQFGTDQADSAYRVEVDAQGNILVVGTTEGDFARTNRGNSDAFVTKFGADGGMLWSQQLGTSFDDGFSDIATDSAGNYFVSGYSGGSFGGSNAGFHDVVVAKFDADGNLQWTEQFGGDLSESGAGIALDENGNAYVAGSTRSRLEQGVQYGFYDAFVSKIDASGSIKWIKQFGSSHTEFVSGVAVDAAGDILVSGHSSGLAGGFHLFSLFVSKFDETGQSKWTHVVDSGSEDDGGELAVDALGNVYVAGSTRGVIGEINYGSYDAVVVKLDTDGNELWAKQIGTAAAEHGYGIALANDAILYLVGMTTGDLGAANAGGDDLFLARIASIPLPGDYNRDGAVDASDYVIWRKSEGTPAGYNSWRSHFGMPAGSSLGAATGNQNVPEPACAWTLILAAAGVAFKQRRTRSSMPATQWRREPAGR